MSEHIVVRRRLAALDEAIETLTREWGETCLSGGPISVWTDRIGATLPEEFADGGVPVHGIVAMLQEIRDDVTEVARQVERHAMEGGPAEWAPVTLTIEMGGKSFPKGIVGFEYRTEAP